MTASVAGIHLTGIHSARPAGNTVPDGSLYSCTTHSLIYQSSYGGNSWSTWASLTGAGMSNPMTAVGDIIQGGTAGAPELLAAPLTGKVLQGAGVTTRVAYKYPPGYEIDYAEFTATVSPLSSTHISDASALLVVAGNSVAYDGSTIVLIEFFAPYVLPVHTDGGAVVFVLYDGASDVGRLGVVQQNGSTTNSVGAPARLSRRLTPSNASHTYSVKAFVAVGNGTVGAGAGGSGVYYPGYIRITKVSGGA